MDAIRLVAALAVVYAHSYPIGRGLNTPDPLEPFLGGIGLGDYAVRVFFILSGFLLSSSLDSSPDPLRYLANRLLRLVPGFAFAIFVSVLLFGPFMTDMGWRLVFSAKAWSSIYWSISCLSDMVSFQLSRVPQPGLVWFMNGSLWSIPYELVCYLVLLCLYMLLRKDSRVAWAALGIAAFTLAAPRLGLAAGPERAQEISLPLAMFPSTLPYFCGGAAFYAVYKRWGMPRFAAPVALAALLASAVFHLESETLALAGPVLIVSLGSRRTALSRVPETLGDISYGVYLFGWPAGLLVAATTGTTSALVIFGLSLPLILASAYAMHQVVERPVSTRLRPWLLQYLPSFTLPGPDDRADDRRRAVETGARLVAYVFCFLMVARFTVYPYPFGLNWFGFQVSQLVEIIVVSAAIIAAGDWWARRLRARGGTGQRAIAAVRTGS